MVSRHNPLYAFQRQPSGKWPTKFVEPNRLPYNNTPGIGPWIAKVGRILDLWANPCSPDPNIWAFAFWQALPVLLITPITPSATDYLIRRNSIGPGPFHGQRGKFSFDVWDIIHGSPVPESQPSWTRFPLLEWGQRLLWYFAIIDGTLDAIIQWESLAYQYAGCHAPQSPWAHCATTDSGFWAPPLTGPVFQGFTELSANIFTANTTGVLTGPGYAPTLSASMSWDDHGLPDALKPNGSLKLIDGTTDLGPPQSVLSATGVRTDSWMIRNYFTDPVGHNFFFYWQGSGWLNVESASMEAAAANKADLFYPLAHGWRK